LLGEGDGGVLEVLAEEALDEGFARENVPVDSAQSSLKLVA